MLGGVIVQKSTWRWIYLFNAPVAVLGVLPLVFFWPYDNTTKKQLWKNVDVLGMLLLTSASCLLVFVLNQAGAAFYDWKDTVIVVCLAISGFCWLSLVLWILLLSRKMSWKIDPIFPGRLVATGPNGPGIA